jgi:hypothetical protein
MGKWIERQISKERNEWQGKEVLVGRLEVVKKEISTLEEKIQRRRPGSPRRRSARRSSRRTPSCRRSGRASDAALRMEGEVPPPRSVPEATRRSRAALPAD